MPLTLKFEKGLLTSLPAMRVFQKTNAKLNAGGSEASQTWFVAEENDNLFVTIKNTPSASFTANEYEAIGRRMGSVGLLMEGGSQLHAFYSPDNPESAASTGKGLSFAKTAPGQNSEFIWATDRDKQPTLSTPAGTNIEIEKNSLSVRRNVFGFLEVSGRVKNHNISDATFVQVGIIAYDENNRLAGGETTYIEGTNRKLTSVYTNTCLLPGETGYFETLGLTIDFAKAKRIEYFVLAWVRSSSAPSGRLTVTSHTVSRDSLGYATVAGVVKNSGTVPIKSVRVYVIGLDGSGKVLGVSSSTSPTKTSLARDESTSFSKSTLMNYSEVRSVDFRGEWDDDTSSTVATIESEMKSLTVPELRELRDIRIREQLKRERLAHPQSEFVSFAQEHIRVK